MYAEDGAVPSKTPAAPSNPFLGRIKATSVPPPHTVKTLRCSIARAEDIKDITKTSLFLTPYSQSPMRNADKVILNRNDLGSTPHEPLAIVTWIKHLDSERRLESEVATEPDTTAPLEIRYRTSIQQSFRINILILWGSWNSWNTNRLFQCFSYYCYLSCFDALY